MERKYYTNERSQQIILALLKANGIRKVVASPGTTNITLVASMQQDSFFEMYSSVDERSAAYIACGLAAESGEPVVITCTGATASRNYMPGLTEAYYRKLPIIAITAMQGTFKIGHHIPQNIDRRSIPNDIAVLSVDIPVTRDATDEWDCTIKINKALQALKRRGGGPVHINLATTYSPDFSVKELPPARIIRHITIQDELPALPQGRIGVFVGSHQAWTREQNEAIDAFCATHDAVVFCDHTSNYKGKYRILFSLLLSQDNYRTKLGNLDLLIHIGEVSGDYATLDLKAKEAWRVNEDGEIRDTFRTLRYIFEMPEECFFHAYAKKGENKNIFLKACQEEYDNIYAKLPEIPFSNIWIAKQLAPRLPEYAVLHLGILNTLRSWNFFEIPRSVLSYSNVGGFGIDGNISALVGSSLAHKEKLYFGILGDLAFFYDMNVIGNRHVGNNVRILLINNGRGVEFRNYNHAAAQFGEAADEYIAAAGHYGNQSSKLVKHYAEDLGYEYLCASSKEDFEKAVARYLAPELTDKPILFEVFTRTEEEQKAIKTVHSVLSSPSGIIKNTVKNALGSKIIEQIKKILK